jgi:hypothetical protein
VEWSVLFKVVADDPERGRATGAADDGPYRPELLDQLLARLPRTDSRYTGGGRDFTITFWIEANDAADATARGWEVLADAARQLDLPPGRPIRTHSASAAQRLTGYAGIKPRVHDERAWSVLVKAQRQSGSGRIVGQAEIGRIGELLGADATVGGSGDVVVARFWVSAAGAVEANEAAGRSLGQALAAVVPGSWQIVRAHHAVAHERAEELYAGADARAGQQARP